VQEGWANKVDETALFEIWEDKKTGFSTKNQIDLTILYLFCWLGLMGGLYVFRAYNYK
jgi:hypothetical protein